MSEGDTRIESTNSREQFNLLEERTPAIGELEDLALVLADTSGMIAGRFEQRDLRNQLRAIYNGQEASDPNLPFGFDKLAQAAGIVYNNQPADTIPQALTRSELTFLVHNLLTPVQGSRGTFTPQQLQDSIQQVLEGKKGVSEITRSCGLRAITTGVLKSTPHK